MSKTLLFISHDAGQSGAPIVLLNLLRWLKANTDYSLRVLCRHGGPLESAFREVATVTVFRRSAKLLKTLVGRAIAAANIDGFLNTVRLKLRRWRSLTDGVDLIYSNTCANGRLIDLLSFIGRPVIVHIHELESVIRQPDVGIDSFLTGIRYASRIVAASEAVRKNLIVGHAIDPSRIDLIYEFIPARRQTSGSAEHTRAEIRKRLNIPDGAVLVCGCGTISERKGTDLFSNPPGTFSRMGLVGIPIFYGSGTPTTCVMKTACAEASLR